MQEAAWPHRGRISATHVITGPQAGHAPGTHVEHVLIYLVRGSVLMGYGRAVRIKAGSMIVVPAGVPHQTLEASACERWCVGFCAPCFGLSEAQAIMAPFSRVRAGAVPVVPVARERRERVMALMSELGQECARRVPESLDLQRSLLTLLLGELRRGEPRAALSDGAGPMVTEALTFIQSHSLSNISLSDVAKAVCRSPAHVATSVKQATGYTVGEWIRHARVHEAAAWLLHSDASLDEVAAHVGWQDKTHFIRQFKKTYGQTPAAWRRAQLSP